MTNSDTEVSRQAVHSLVEVAIELGEAVEQNGGASIQAVQLKAELVAAAYSVYMAYKNDNPQEFKR
jgi:hypothetical protein